MGGRLFARSRREARVWACARGREPAAPTARVSATASHGDGDVLLRPPWLLHTCTRVHTWRAVPPATHPRPLCVRCHSRRPCPRHGPRPMDDGDAECHCIAFPTQTHSHAPDQQQLLTPSRKRHAPSYCTCTWTCTCRCCVYMCPTPTTVSSKCLCVCAHTLGPHDGR